MYASADRGDARGAISYTWELINKPIASKLTTGDLQRANTRNPTLTPDVAGDFELEFTYQVRKQKATDTIVLSATTKNLPPVVELGDITWSFKDGHPVMLDGSQCYDPNGDSLTAQWKIIDQPALSTRETTDIAHPERLQSGSKLEGAKYYIFFALCMLVTALLFVPVALRYQVKSYLPGTDQADLETH